MTDRVGDFIRKSLADDGFPADIINTVMDQERQPELSRLYRLGLAIAAARRLTAAYKEPA